MSTYEKIASILLALVLLGLTIASYREIKEPPEQKGAPSSFDQSRGQDFKIGPFTNTVSEHYSGGLESACEPLQPVIIAALHDIKERLEHEATSYLAGAEDEFEVNQTVLQVLCNKNAEIILADSNGNTLILQKVPFVRAVPQGSGADDIGTTVRINATIVPKGAATPAAITTYGEVLIPDRFLDN